MFWPFNKPKGRPLILIREPMNEAELKLCFCDGPQHHLWKGVEQIITTLADTYLDEVAGIGVSERDKAVAVDKSEAVKEVLRQMYEWNQAYKFDANVTPSDAN